jgi:hypothetical protein
MEHLTETFGHSPLVWWIVAAEASFWILLLAGLAVRYLARMRRLSSVLLLAVPFVDVSLIALTAWDLSIGAEPNFSHILAALYLGITVGFGHSIIGRVDAWFAHRFAGAPETWPGARPPHVGGVGPRRRRVCRLERRHRRPRSRVAHAAALFPRRSVGGAALVGGRSLRLGHGHLAPRRPCLRDALPGRT